MKNKRYALFSFDYYYPEGGIDDLQGTFDTPQEAKEHFKSDDFPHGQIVDLETLETLERLEK